jgi:hypothetical protein
MIDLSTRLELLAAQVASERRRPREQIQAFVTGLLTRLRIDGIDDRDAEARTTRDLEHAVRAAFDPGEPLTLQQRRDVLQPLTTFLPTWSPRRVADNARAQRIPGAAKVGQEWMIRKSDFERFVAGKAAAPAPRPPTMDETRALFGDLVAASSHPPSRRSKRRGPLT